MKIKDALIWLTGKVREDDECLIWIRGYGGEKRDTPMTWVNGKHRSVKSWLWELMTGKRAEKGTRVFLTCGNVGCVHPKHLQVKSHSSHQKGSKLGMNVRIKIATTKRETAKFSEEQIYEVRYGELNEHQAKEKFGMSRDHYYKIRQGVVRRDYRNPFMGLGV